MGNRPQDHLAQMYLDIAGVMLVALDRDGYVTMINKKGCEILGRDQKAILGKYWFDLAIPRKYSDEVSRVFKQIIAGEVEPVKFFTNPVVRPDGEERLVEWHNANMYDDGGTIIGTLSSGNDITERAKAEKALRAVAECATTLNDGEKTLMVRLSETVDLLQRITGVSRAYIFKHEEDTGHGPTMTQLAEKCAYGIEPQIDNPLLQQLPYKDLTPEFLDTLLQHKHFSRTPSQMQGFDRKLLEAQSIQTLLVLPIFYGEHLWGFLGFDECHAPRQWQEQEIALLETVTSNIGMAIQRVQEQDRLLRLNTLLETSNAAAHIGTWEVDGKTSKQYWSKEVYAIHEVDMDFDPNVGNGIGFYKEGEDRDRIVRLYQGAFNKGISYDEELRIITAKGNERWIRAVGVPVMEDGRCLRVYGTIQDITKRKRMEEQLIQAKQEAEAANQAKTRFLSHMSHELRTPLNGMIGFVDFLMHSPLNDKQKAHLKYIHYSSNLLKQVIGNILDFSKIESGKMQLYETPTDLRALCAHVIKIFEFQANEQWNTLHLEYDDTIPQKIDVDGLRLEQVLLNLVGNAVKFTHRGSITLKVTFTHDQQLPQSDSIHFEVCDTGIGISEAAIEKIFHEFEQAEPSTTSRYGGTGLGIPIIQGILELMGTSLRIQSEVGKGSQFSFDISLDKTKDTSLQDRPPKEPAHQETSDDRQPDKAGLKPHSSCSGIVLLVEDDLLNMLLLKKLLHKIIPDVKIIEAKNGEEGVRMAIEHSPCLIFMDIAMPIMDGITATKEIRKHEANGENHATIIALTGIADQESREACFASGMDGFLSKPVIPKDFEKTIQQWVHDHR